MKISAFFLCVASNCVSTFAAGIPRLAISDLGRRYNPNANKGSCECPLAGPSGTCIIKPLSGHDPNEAESATCEGPGMYYTCGGSYNSPNCNLCAQSYLNNARIGPEIIDCPGITWCSDDSGKTFRKCKLHETAYHPKYHIIVRVGSTTFKVGDYDFNQINSVIADSCNAAGCDGGTSQTINFNNLDSTRKIVPTKGTITVHGFADNNQKIVDSLVSTVSTVLQHSKQCTTVRATKCSLKRENPFQTHGCGPIQWEECSMVNFVQATAYDIDSDAVAQLTFSGESTNIGFPCDTFLGAFSAAATGLDTIPAVQGGMAVASIICDLIKGDKDE